MLRTPALWALITLFAATIACGDDDDNNNSSPGQSGGGLTLQGQVVDYPDPGEDREISLGTYFSETQENVTFGTGSLSASGEFTFTLEDNDFSNGYQPVEDFFDRICEATGPTLTLSDDDAGVLRRPTMGFATEMLSGEFGLSAVSLSSSEDTAGRAQAELFPRRHGDTLAIWVNADRDVTVQGTCIIAFETTRNVESTIDLSLNRGWNEIIVESITDSGTPAELSFETRERPAELTWRFHKVGS